MASAWEKADYPNGRSVALLVSSVLRDRRSWFSYKARWTPDYESSSFAKYCLFALTNSTGGSFFNHFDGSVDLLDDLDDHYTARTHKKERNEMVEKFQMICKKCEYSEPQCSPTNTTSANL